MEFLKIDSMNISTLLLCMANFIQNRGVDRNKINNVTQLQGFGQVAWEFILSIYKSEWDALTTNNNNRMFRQNISSKFTSKVKDNSLVKRTTQSKDIQIEVVKLSPSIPARLSKKILKNTNTSINTSIVKSILKNNYIFNNISLTLKPQVIKTLSKLDMTIVWLDIWNVQSGSKAKGLINRCFNIGSFIAIICDMNMNPGVIQYKNCWK